MNDLSDLRFPAFLGLVISLCIIVGFIVERLIEWAAGGLAAPIAYGLSVAIGLTGGFKAASWWDAHGPNQK